MLALTKSLPGGNCLQAEVTESPAHPTGDPVRQWPQGARQPGKNGMAAIPIQIGNQNQIGNLGLVARQPGKNGMATIPIQARKAFPTRSPHLN